MKISMKLTVLFFCLFLFAACPEMGYKNLIEVDNKSDHNITIYVGVAPFSHGSTLYPDTILPINRKTGFEIKKDQSGYYSFNYQYMKDNNDTLSFFIWDTDTAIVVPWDSIRSKYQILQRYDLSFNDLQNLKWKLSYPPSSNMRAIKMYPPYK